jgi:tetratricopeptide (TPR) repeat protein
MRGPAAAALCALLGLGVTAAARAQSAAQPGFEFTPALEQSFVRLRALSKELLSGPSANTDVRERLLAEARALSFPRLPDQSVAASWKAVRAAQAGDTSAARLALEDAERLDPGRAETAFAAATVAWRSGAWPGWLTQQARAYRRLLADSQWGRIARRDLATWLFFSWLVTGLLFVAVSVAVRGHQQWEILRITLSRFLPLGVTGALAGLAMVWPVFLPHGLAVLVLFWSVLLWSRASRSERVVLACIALSYCLLPALAGRQQQLLSLDASPANHALDSLQDGRLPGTFFSDLAVLQATLPDDPAVRQLVGDVHRRFGQWEFARRTYADLIQADGENADAMIGLGACYFQRGDAKRAIELFEQAGEVNPASAEAFYNLSQAFSAGYLFDESRRALARATSIDSGLVSGWIASPPVGRIVVPDGGLRRRAQIVTALAARRPAPGFGRLPLWTLGFAAAALLSAMGWAAAVAAGHVEIPEAAKTRRKVDDLPDAWQAALPSFRAVSKGQAFLAIGALWPVAGLGVAPFAGSWSQKIPLALGSGWAFPGGLAILGLALLLGLRALLLRLRET